MCAARRIPPSTFESNLSSSSRRLVKSSESDHPVYFDPHLHSEDRVNVSRDAVLRCIDDSQAVAADLTAQMTYLDRYFISPAIEGVRQMHVDTKKALDQLDAPREEGFDPVLRFIAAVKESQSFDDLSQRIAEIRARGSELLGEWSQLTSAVATRGKPTEMPPDQTVLCPIDGTPIPLDTSQSRAECPECGYRFIVRPFSENRPPARKSPVRFPWSRRLNRKA